MRILLVTSDEPVGREMAQRLEQDGHEIIRLTARGDDLLTTVERGARFHAALLDQCVLGKGWSRQVRQLRRRAPYLPAVVLLAPGAEHGWRHAILAGAFEAVPLRSSLEVILHALSRAVDYSAGKPLSETLRLRATNEATNPTLGRFRG